MTFEEMENLAEDWGNHIPHYDNRSLEEMRSEAWEESFGETESEDNSFYEEGCDEE